MPFEHENPSGPWALVRDIVLVALPTSPTHSFVLTHFVAYFLAAFLPKCLFLSAAFRAPKGSISHSLAKQVFELHWSSTYYLLYRSLTIYSDRALYGCYNKMSPLPGSPGILHAHLQLSLGSDSSTCAYVSKLEVPAEWGLHPKLSILTGLAPEGPSSTPQNFQSFPRVNPHGLVGHTSS